VNSAAAAVPFDNILTTLWRPGLRSRTGPSTSIRFINESASDLKLLWVDYAGNLAQEEPFHAGSEIVAHTYDRHSRRLWNPLKTCMDVGAQRPYVLYHSPELHPHEVVK
jgi:hypothetical protein